MQYLFNKYIRNLDIKDFSFLLFLLGIFFLPSSLLISSFFLLPSGILGGFLQKKAFFQDKWNYPFMIFGYLIILSALLQNFVFNNIYHEIWDPKLSIIGMGNWLPFIWLFWALQPYLDSKYKRRCLAIVLISGTFPVIVSGFGQYFFDWTGPLETLNGLIIWYQRPISNPGGLSGLFNNQNYAGSWLNFVWPFCIALFIEKRKNIFRKTITFAFLSSVGLAAFLTYSRNAWIGLITTLPIVIGKKAIIRILMLVTLIIFIFSIFLILNQWTTSQIINLLPEKILREFSSDGYKDLDVSRLKIFKSAIEIIKFSPFFGVGASSFSDIYLLETNFWKGHSHNLLIELAISYGIPATIIFFFTITTIITISCIRIFGQKQPLENNIFDRACWAAFFFFLISQLADIQYFDGKISIISWILLAGLKEIIEDKDYKDELV